MPVALTLLCEPAMQAQGRRTLPEATASTSSAPAGASYRFLVRSAEEAVGTIRQQLGGEARVVSVRAVKAGGFAGLLGSTRLEVIAQMPAPASASVVPEPPIATLDGVSTATHVTPSRQESLPRATYAAAAAAAAAGEGGVSAATLNPEPPVAKRPDAPRASAATPSPRLETLLRRSGLSEALIARLQATAGWPDRPDRPLHENLAEVAAQIRQMAAGMKTPRLADRAAFIGLPGVGCSTALCKWLAAEVFGRGRHGVVASIEFDRPKTAEDVAVFAELLGLEFSRQVPAARAGAEGFCYVDTPPLSLTKPEENARLRAFLDAQRIPGRVLVLSGLLDGAILRQACTAGLELGCTHVVFTQLDQLPQWGKLWDFLIEAPLAPLMVTVGPSLTGECETEVIGTLLRRTFPWS